MGAFPPMVVAAACCVGILLHLAISSSKGLIAFIPFSFPPIFPSSSNLNSQNSIIKISNDNINDDKTESVSPRRLSVSGAFINLVTQVATNSEIRQLMSQWTGMVGEIFKGRDTSEASVPYYWKVPECVLTVDFASVMDSGVADSAKVALAYSPKHNAIMLAFVEESSEFIQVFKRPTPRIQFLHLPAECMVDANTTYSAFCSKPKGKCIILRLDINLTKITRQMMNALKPIPPRDFVQDLMEKEGLLYSDAVDVLEAPTTVERLLFEPLTCIMHTRVHAASRDHVFVFHNPLDHSLRVDAQHSNGSWFRRKVIIPLGCGGTHDAHFVTSVYLQADGLYKVVIKTLVARGTDQRRKSDDNIEIRTGSDVRPISELKFGEHDPKDLFPHARFIPYESMIIGHPF